MYRLQTFYCFRYKNSVAAVQSRDLYIYVIQHNEDADSGSGDQRDKDVCDAGDDDLNHLDDHLDMDLPPSSGTILSKLHISE